MTKMKRLLRRRKNLIVAFMAAAGSFLLGVTLPMNLRANGPVAPMQAQVLAVSQSQEPKPISNVNGLTGAIAHRVEFSQKALASLQETRFQSGLPSQFKGTTMRQAKLDSQHKAIALTFDDGPWPTTTRQILDILKENNIKACLLYTSDAADE